MNTVKKIINIYNRDTIKYIIILIYLTLSFYEGYINYIVAPITRYFLIFSCVYFFSNSKLKIKLNSEHSFLFLWFLYNTISLLWGYSDSVGIEIVNTHFASIIMMLIFVLAVNTEEWKEDLTNKLLKAILYLGLSISTLSIMFSQPYISEDYTARLTLTIKGIQMDPNDLSIIYLFTVIVGLYFIVFKKSSRFISFITIFISILAMLHTSSRGGIISLLIIIFYLIIRINLAKKVKLIIFASIAILLLLQLTPDASINRLFYTSYGSGSGRLDFWRESLSTFINNPIWGTGWGGNSIRVHNTFLNILVSNGIIGIILFGLYFIIAFVKSFSRKNIITEILLLYNIIPFMFIEGITKRFFWNAIIITIILNKSQKDIT